eukprot:150322-Chlamydomonas_euryale.AAC.3
MHTHSDARPPPRLVQESRLRSSSWAALCPRFSRRGPPPKTCTARRRSSSSRRPAAGRALCWGALPWPAALQTAVGRIVVSLLWPVALQTAVGRSVKVLLWRRWLQLLRRPTTVPPLDCAALHQRLPLFRLRCPAATPHTWLSRGHDSSRLPRNNASSRLPRNNAFSYLPRNDASSQRPRHNASFRPSRRNASPWLPSNNLPAAPPQRLLPAALPQRLALQDVIDGGVGDDGSGMPMTDQARGELFAALQGGRRLQQGATNETVNVQVGCRPAVFPPLPVCFQSVILYPLALSLASHTVPS